MWTFSDHADLLNEYNVELKGPFNYSARDKAGLPRDWWENCIILVVWLVHKNPDGFGVLIIWYQILLLIFLETKRGILNLILCKYVLSFWLAVCFICCLGMIHHLQKCRIRVINRTKMRSFLWYVILAFKPHVKLILEIFFTPYFCLKEM